MHKLFKEAVYNNKWLWFHIVAGGILCKIFLTFTHPPMAIALVFLLAIGWEFVEYFVQSPEKIDKTYGSFKEFFLDAIGDIFGAFFMAIIVGL